MSRRYRLDELVHYGVKGQKWGRRRYQNKDGSLTPEGRKRYGSEENFEKQYPAEQKEVQKAVLTGTKKAVDGAKEINRVSREMNSEHTRKLQKKADKAVEEAVRERAKKMSDKELREAVNRLNMEENYTRMMQNRERIDMGESKASKFMDHAATALTVTSTALSIALAVKELKK